jgi:hypothetical protein
LALYYPPGRKRGPNPADSFTKLYEEELKEADRLGWRDEDGSWHDAAELGVAMMENYIDHYGKDDEWEVVVTEQPFKVTVYDPTTYDPNHPAEAQDPTEWFTYVGVIDGLWRHRPSGKLWIPDHKTTQGIGGTTEHPNIPAYLMMDDQAGAYWSYGVEGLIARKLMARNTRLTGMLFNFMRKGLPDERPYKIQNKRKIHLNKDGTVSKRQPPPYFVRIPILRDEYDREYAQVRAEEDYARIEAVRDGRIPPLKKPGQFTCTMCGVRDICELHETGNDWRGMAAQMMEPHDHYAQHEIEEGR